MQAVHPETTAPEPPPPSLDDGMNLSEFMNRFQDSIAQHVIDTYRPKYQPQAHRDAPLPNLLREPMGRQGHTIRATAYSLREHRGTTIVGEMGTGKTFLAIAAARTASFRRVLVICPPHMVAKWKREVALTLGPQDAHPVIVETLTELQDIVKQWRTDDTGRTLFLILSRERAKLTHGWRNVANWKTQRYMQADTPPQARCVHCSATITDRDGNPLYQSDLDAVKHRLKCVHCKQPLWEATRIQNHKKPRIALAEYIKKRVKNFFDLFVGDEIHEYKEKDSGQGIAAGNLAQHCGRSLCLTGTIMGGYSSSLFYLLYRFHPGFRESFSFDGKSDWVNKYGFQQYTRVTKNEPIEEDGRASIRKLSGNKPPKEIPGLMPDALFHLIGHTIFVRLSDVSRNLPEYTELIMTTPTDEQVDDTGWSQRTAYRYVHDELRTAIMAKGWDGRLTAAYLQTLLAYPDGCTKGAIVIHPDTQEPIIDMPPLEDRMYPKEKHLVDLIKRERDENRRCMVYASHTDTRDITQRLHAMLTQAGIPATVMRSRTTKTADREKWIADQVAKDVHTVICNPKLVQTGLDLIDFPTIIWFQPDYSVYTMRQASRRSWRIGQTEPVRVYYMTYEDCVQTDALKLIAKKTSASLTVEGELPEDGLASYGDTADNVYMALAKQLAGQLPPPEDNLEDLFRLSRIEEQDDLRELTTAEYRTDSDWRPWNQESATGIQVRSVTTDGSLLPPTPIIAKGRKGKHGQLTMFHMEQFARN